MPRDFLRRALQIGALVGATALLPSAIAAVSVLYYLWVPRYSTVAYFEKLGFNLRLDFYLTDPASGKSGRYLSVITSSAYHMVNLAGGDWAHRARTSVYRVDDDHVAVLSPQGHDYMIALKPFAAAPVVSGGGEAWQYLGAFDFVFPQGARARLQFFDPRQLAECIPMGTGDPAGWRGMPRAQARRAVCPTG